VPTETEAAVAAPSFETDVKVLFRERDQRSMKKAFDLWSYDDVKTHAAAIYEQVASGSMPCDTAWSPEQVAVFKGWMDGDFPV
jgi:hypothetical protein